MTGVLFGDTSRGQRIRSDALSDKVEIILVSHQRLLDFIDGQYCVRNDRLASNVVQEVLLYLLHCFVLLLTPMRRVVILIIRFYDKRIGA